MITSAWLSHSPSDFPRSNSATFHTPAPFFLLHPPQKWFAYLSPALTGSKRGRDGEEEEEEEEEGEEGGGGKSHPGSPSVLVQHKLFQGLLITLRTATSLQREEVRAKTGIVVIPIDHDVGHAVGQALTESGQWMEQKTRMNLSSSWLKEALSYADMKALAGVMGETSGSCAFLYALRDYCTPHKDNSAKNSRVMVRLGEASDTEHFFMVQGRKGEVVNIVMEGSCFYYGEDPTLLSRVVHAVPSTTEGTGDVMTLLITLPKDFTPEGFTGDWLEAAKGLNTGELWMNPITTKYKRSRADIPVEKKIEGGELPNALFPLPYTPITPPPPYWGRTPHLPATW